MATAERLQGEIASRNHLEFIKYMWKRDDPFIIGRHTREICNEIDIAIENYKNGISTFLAIKCPFRHGKTDLVSRYLPPNFIGKFPNQEIIVCGYNFGIVSDFSTFARDVMRDEKYRNVYPNIRLSKTEQSIEKWGIDGKLGKVYWIGLGGGITGRGGSLIILDDFFKKREEAESENEREKVWTSIKNEVMTRRAPVCIVIFLATPWHTDDPFGRIQKHMEEDPKFPQFKFIKFPAFNDKYPEGVLFPERFSKDWYETQYATLGRYEASGLLQCEPMVQGGNLLRIDKIKIIDDMPADIECTRGWDLASSQKQRMKEDPDYTVGIKLGLMKIPSNIDGIFINVIYIYDMIRGRWESTERDEIIRNTAIADGDIEIGIEAYGPYKDAYTALAKILHGIRIVKKLQLPGDKVTKALPLEPIFQAGNIYIKKAPWNDDFLKEISEFPSGKHDDIADALVTAFETHNPFKKKLFPYNSQKRADIKIEWNETGTYMFHYASIIQLKDMSMYIIQCLWDSVKKNLYVYDAWESDGDLDEIAMTLTDRMKLTQYKHEKIVVNENMQAKKAHELSGMQLLKRAFKKIGVKAIIVRPVKYNESGSIIMATQLFTENRIIVSNTAEKAAYQFSGWSIEKGKPEKDMGYCMALCHLLSELKRTQIIKPTIPERDYVYG